MPDNLIPIYLEVGDKRLFAAALDWPGWCRRGKDEASALETLLAYTGRYTAVIKPTGLAFAAPSAVSDFSLVERLPGNFATSFGTPNVVPAYDAQPLVGDDLDRQLVILDACWRAFDSIVASAVGRELRKGPRGGGRDLDAIQRHVLDAAHAYLRHVGVNLSIANPGDAAQYALQIQEATRLALINIALHGLPPPGPRGGVRWPSRYLLRRSAWHILDHAWEIEDRITGRNPV